MSNITFTQVNSPISFELQATDDGEVLAFKGAVLARAETNLNSDDIDTAGIGQLAGSLIGRPVDVEHDTGSNCGVFTKAEPIEGSTALSVDGFVWADRYPEQARGMQTGTHALSVEATADTAICSICNQSFDSSENYCEHLVNRKLYGAVRKLRGLHGKGGAVTTRPAGSNTKFNPTQVYFVASHKEVVMPKPVAVQEPVVPVIPDPVVPPVVVAAVPEPVVAATHPPAEPVAEPVVASAEPPVEPDGDDKDKDALKAQVDEMAKCMGEMQTAMASISETIKAIQSIQVEQKVMARRAVLRGSVSDDEWEKDKDTIMGMDEKAFYLFASTRQPVRLTLAAGVRLPETSVAGGTKEPLTLKRG